MVAPSRLAHFVFRTNRLDAMVRWYCTLLEARVAYADEGISFITYDDEHHRVAFVALDTYAEKPPGLQVGFYHAAFAFRDLGELLGNYQRLKSEGIVPWRSINHGPTVSFYYRDPDGNDIEMQVDSFPDAAATNAWMRSEAFARNPIGINFDAEQMIAQRARGVPDAVLMRRPDS